MLKKSTSDEWNRYLYKLSKQFENDKVLLILNWSLRMLALMFLVAYFVERQETYSPSDIAMIRKGLLLFFAYQMLSGFFGIINSDWFLRKEVKLVQVLVELMFYTAFYYLTGDPRSEAFYLLFIPLFMAVRFLDPRLAILCILIACICLYGVLWGLESNSRSDFLFHGYSLGIIYWPRVIFMVGVTLSYLLRRHSSMISELREDDTEITNLLKSLEDGVFVVDLQLRLQFVNDTLQARHGSFIAGQPCQEYFRCQDILCQRNQEIGKDHNPLSTPVKEEGVFVDQDGDHYQVEVSLRPLPDESGEIVGFIAIVRDLEKQKQTLKELREQLHLYGNQVQSLTLQKATWQDTYAEMGRRLTRIEDRNSLLQFVVEETMKRLHAETSCLFILEHDELRRIAIAGISKNQINEEHYHRGQGITGKVVEPGEGGRYGQSVRSNNVDHDPEVIREYLNEYQVVLKTRQVKHLVAVPLNGDEKSFGVLRVVNKLDTRGRLDEEGFSQEDEDFLVTIAAMVAIALENNRLLDEARQQYEQISNLYTIADTMLEISRVVNTNLNKKELLQNLLDEVSRVITFDSISIQLVEDNQLRVIECKGFTDREKVMSLRFPLHDRGFPNSCVITTGEPLLLADVRQKYPHFLEQAAYYQSGNIRAWLGVPLIHRNNVIGMIAFDHSQPGFYNKEMQDRAIMFANQVAIALANAQLFQEKLAQMVSLKSLYQASQVAASPLELTQVLRKIVKLTDDVVKSDHTGVVVIGENGELVTSVETRLVGDELHERARDNGVTQQVIRTRRPIFFENVTPEDGAVHNPAILQNHFRSYAGFPIISGKKVRGVLFVHSLMPGQFKEWEKLLRTFCNQAAFAIENAMQYEQTSRQAKMLTRFVKASTGLIPHTKLEDLLPYCAEQGSRIFQVEDCSIYLTNKERGTIDLVASSTIPPEIWNRRESSLERPGLTAFVANTGTTLNLGEDEYQNHPAWGGREGEPFVEHLRFLPSQKCHSLLLCPLVDSHGRCVGVLKLENQLGQNTGRRFLDFEVALHKTFASHIGMAVERARLLQRLDREARNEGRKALAFDLHEINSFIHGALVMRLEITGEKLARHNYKGVREDLGTMSKAAQTVHTNLRWIHNEFMNDTVFRELGLISSLENAARLLDISIECLVTGRTPLSVEVEYALYKIGLEALTNSTKHAGQPVKAWIELNTSDQGYVFKVQDDGCGFNMASVLLRKDNFGFESMHRTATAIGAHVQIESQPGKGTVVLVEGPLVKDGG